TLYLPLSVIELILEQQQVVPTCRSHVCSSSVAVLSVYDAADRLAGFECPNLVCDLGDRFIAQGRCGDMRRDGEMWVAPERMLRWERFVFENIECRPNDTSFGQRFQK